MYFIFCYYNVYCFLVSLVHLGIWGWIQSIYLVFNIIHELIIITLSYYCHLSFFFVYTWFNINELIPSNLVDYIIFFCHLTSIWLTVRICLSFSFASLLFFIFVWVVRENVCDAVLSPSFFFFFFFLVLLHLPFTPHLNTQFIIDLHCNIIIDVHNVCSVRANLYICIRILVIFLVFFLFQAHTAESKMFKRNEN